MHFKNALIVKTGTKCQDFTREEANYHSDYDIYLMSTENQERSIYAYFKQISTSRR